MKKKILLFLCLSLSFQDLQGLELNRVILSTNNDPLYIQFWSVVAPIWQRMGLRPTLVLVANEDCVVDESIGDVIRFPPLSDVPVSLQTQVIRLFAPVLFPEEGCLISDIDMLPVSRSYFFDGARDCPQDSFLVYRDGERWPMCYVAGTGAVFSSIFGVSQLEEFPDLIRYWASFGHGWNTDELLMKRFVNQWKTDLSGSVYFLKNGWGPRLDRSDWRISQDSLNVDAYVDCHSARPYKTYKESIDRVVEAIHDRLEREGF